MERAGDTNKRTNIRAEQTGQRAICNVCGKRVFSKVGSKNVNHWSHYRGVKCAPPKREEFVVELTTLSGVSLSKDFIRIVRGGRGNYVEFAWAQVTCKLLYKFPTRGFEDLAFNPADPGQQTYMKWLRDSKGCFYIWLFPENDPDTKVYFQLKTVNYADYKIGKLYVHPTMLKGDLA